ncbi:hypothetical protein UCDDA912_g05719 [Diaporthe ampelina]|uniref:Uncharacterized protein n=1 Tax=Diaporthe ampelina TaxID=1214573 RepID=A0A0G2FJS5_9PEZI|nr:hypothetical protein UCDDA912_g05719 [Diaporthe ampelina]
MEGMIPCFPDTSNLNITFSDVEKECQGELTSFYQFQWGQQEGSSSFMPCLLVDPAQQAYPGLEVTSSADPAHELYSPASTDVVMIDTPTTSEGSSPTTSDSPLLECEICHWRPDMGGKRPSNKLRLAVEKHVKRNHYSRDYRCRVCNQSFRNRPDNVKPHVRRKHPSKLAELYPETTAQQDGPQPCDKARALAKPAARRRASMPTPTSQASPARVKSVRRQSR